VYLTFGGGKLGDYDMEPKPTWHLSLNGKPDAHAGLQNLFDVTGAVRWSEIEGQYVRIRQDGISLRLGHITQDIWIDNHGQMVEPEPSE